VRQEPQLIVPILNVAQESEFSVGSIISFNIILGEAWLKTNSGIMDYAHGQLCQWTVKGIQRMSFDTMPHTQDDQPRETLDGQTQDPGTLDPLHTIVCGDIREGVKILTVRVVSITHQLI